MFNYFYNVLPEDIRDVIWKMVHKSRMDSIHLAMQGEIWDEYRRQTDETSSQRGGYLLGALAKRLFFIRKIKEYNSLKAGGRPFYAYSGLNYYGNHYDNDILLTCRSRLQIQTIVATQLGTVSNGQVNPLDIAWKTIINNHWFPYVDPFIESSDYCYSCHWPGITGGRGHIKLCRLKELVRQKGLNGFSNMNKEQLVSYYYTESKTRRIGEMVSE